MKSRTPLSPLFLSLLTLSLGLSTIAGAQGTPIRPPIRQVPRTGPVTTPRLPAPITLGGYPSNAATPNEFFQRLLSGANGTTRPITGKPGNVASGGATQSTQEGAGGPLACSVQKYKISDSPPQYAAGTFDQDKLWVGSLLQSRGLSVGVGSLSSLNVPASKRAPLRLTSQLPVQGGSATVSATQSGYNDALARIRQSVSGTPIGSTVRYEMTEEDGFESSALKLGLNASYLTNKVSASLKTQSQGGNHKLTAVFYQNAFTVNADLGNQSPAAALFSGLTVDDLKTLGTDKQLAYNNLPVYVDSMTYGRLLLVTMESQYSASEMDLALRASASFGAGSVSASLDAGQKKVLSSSRFSVYASGGNESQVVDLIRTGQLGSYFTGTTSPTTFVPISFTTRNLGDNSYAAKFVSGEYSVTTCDAASLSMNMQALYHSVDPNDNAFDDVYGFIRFDGQLLWERGQHDNIDVYKGMTVRLYPDTNQQFNKVSPYTINVNYGSGRQAFLDMNLMDYDKGSNNDPLGSLRLNVNMDEVATEFRNNRNLDVVRRIYPVRASDTRGEVILEFRR
ncbi:thiol-activated cytolysin family protein [Deinococcus altitudinis]|uniref:thiol-activated cytolysin family protein n=1 Tax=Deinococcus altitudinis TaxID=468914 RepID=UPI0038924CE6